MATLDAPLGRPGSGVTRTEAGAWPARARRAQAAAFARWWRTTWPALVFLPLLLAAVLYAKLPEAFLPMGEDQGLFNYGAQVLLDGGQLYRDFWETKPPLEYFFRAGVLSLIVEPWSSRCYVGQAYTTCGQLVLHLLDYAYTLVTALLVYAVARGGGLRRPFAWLAALLAGVFMSLVMVSQEGNTPEKHLLLPLTVAVWAAHQATTARPRRAAAWLVLAGVAIATAALFKPPALIAIGPAGLYLLLRADGSPSLVARGRSALVRLLPLAGGTLLGLAPVAAYLVLGGLLPDFWEQAVLFNLTQAGTRPERALTTALPRIWEVFSRSSALLWLLGAAGAGLVALAPPGEHRSERRLWGWWALGSVLAILAGGMKLTYPYFLYPVPALGLLGGYALQRGWDIATRLPRVPRLGARATGLLACLAILAVSSSFQRSSLRRMEDEHFPRRTTTTPEEVLATNPDFLPRRGSLYLWGGQTQLYVLTGSKSPSRHLHPYFLSAFHSTDPSYLVRRAEMLADLQRSPPAVILVDQRRLRALDPDGSIGLNPDRFPELQAFLRERYRPTRPYSGWQRYDRTDLNPGEPSERTI